MRFIRLRIANYRGVEALEVEFKPTGITLIQGPNEAGKSSLSEAIGLLFEYADSSRHRAVEAIKPVHRDEGPEIELEAESGPYRFTYFKRFHKKPETRLAITQPRPESLTGRQAHERAEMILRETLDVGLWRALTVQQGEAIQQPVMANQTSLLAALDKAAGGRPADPQEESLFNRVRTECLRYYTEGGVERKDLAQAREVEASARAEVAQIQQSLRELEQDIDRAAILRREIGQLERKEKELTTQADLYASTLEEIEALESELSTARLKLEAVRTSEEMAQKESEGRRRLIEAVADATKEHTIAEESSAASLSALNQADEELRRAQAAFDAAEKDRREADKLAALRQADYEYYRSKLNLEQFQERKSRIDETRRKATEAEEVLARNQVDDQALKSIQEAERALLFATAQLDTGAPSVCLRGLADCSFAMDGSEISLRRGEERNHSVADKCRLTLPGILDIEIAAGSSVDGLSRKVEESRSRLAAVCAAAGVADLEEARKAFEKRREALLHVEAKEKVEKENLRDLSYDELGNRIRVLQKSVSDYLSKRMTKPPMPPDQESAKKAKAESESAQREANGTWEAARKLLDVLRDVREDLNAKHLRARVELEMLAKALKSAEESLTNAREGAPDGVLEQRLAESARMVSIREADVSSADTSLKAKNPERVKTLAETTDGSLQTCRIQLTAAQKELTEVQTRLRIHGEEGLHEKLQTARTHLERASYECRSLIRRAVVAKVLFESMRDERDEARRAYVAPLKEKIEQLAHLVFEDGVQVDISDDLQIASRTSSDGTVPFDSLSGGTREQLSLIFRLACSMIVAKDGGTPVILDDALGYTDPERLPLMGAVLAKAAKDCQIIVLTCIPDRYNNVGQATVVSLA